MQDTAPTTPQPRALTRTWAAHVVYRECGVVTGSSTFTVTMTRTADGFTAEIDGAAAGVLDAARVLESARRDNGLSVLSEVLDVPTPPVIGNARAARLHRLMGRLGLPSAQHYALAAAALGEWAALPSLAALSEREAVTVWGHVCTLYPQARTFTAA